MTKPKPRPKRAVDAVKLSLSRENAKRPEGLKPIEIVKVAICAYQEHVNAETSQTIGHVESADRAGIRRGTQASVDRLLFNANYWLAAYEDRIVEACMPEDAASLLKAVTVWNTHTLKLNTLGNDEAVATFERFCPPFARNNRRGSSKGRGKGPIAEFEAQAREVATRQPECADALCHIARDMKAEASAYDELPAASALDALFAILPVWCLQEKIELVAGSWWEDSDVMTFLAHALKDRFAELGYGDVPCQYFCDAMYEAVDAYQRDISATLSPISELSAPEILQVTLEARKSHPGFETDGYGDALPAWLIAKEQLVWNTVVCALYGPGMARPLLGNAPEMLALQSQAIGEQRSDVITDLAKASFLRYRADRAESGAERGYATFSDQPASLRNSSIANIQSVPAKLDILGYEIVPEVSCYPGQKVTSLSPSEVECLAILEHRRWVDERERDGWTFGITRDVEAKTSPYLVPWEDLPARAQEWNRSAIRSIPALLAGEHLAIARK